ncbi:MAG: DUF2277 domain-containing protein [Candidatus Dojkabacteria bacterium]
MCRNIKPLFNFDPPASDAEIRAAAEQFVRKISGFHKPSKVNETAYSRAIDETSIITKRLLSSLITNSEPHNREIEAQRAHERALKRFGNVSEKEYLL